MSTELCFHDCVGFRAESGYSGRRSWLDLIPVMEDGSEGQKITLFFRDSAFVNAAKMAQAINEAANTQAKVTALTNGQEDHLAAQS